MRQHDIMKEGTEGGKIIKLGRPLPPLVNAVGVSPVRAHSSQKKRVSQSSSSLKEVMEHAGRLDVFVDSRGVA